jgi:hypothetical protein
MIFDEEKFFRKLDEVCDRKIVILILKYGQIPPEIWDRITAGGDLFEFYFDGSLGDLRPEQLVDCWNALFFELEEILKSRQSENNPDANLSH